MTSRIVADELESIVRMLCEKYSDRREDEIAALVHGVYGRLAAEATLTAHLIPLTVNHCHRVLKQSAAPVPLGAKTSDVAVER